MYASIKERAVTADTIMANKYKGKRVQELAYAGILPYVYTGELIYHMVKAKKS